jgi:hypothetical protein
MQQFDKVHKGQSGRAQMCGLLLGFCLSYNLGYLLQYADGELVLLAATQGPKLIPVAMMLCKPMSTILLNATLGGRINRLHAYSATSASCTASRRGM